ncbi:hypothetical protein AC781_08735 [Akkermansia glycaniphila]|nr:hypothetical protein AC781_08735 [Akkermansia glycaniphila]
MTLEVKICIIQPVLIFMSMVTENKLVLSRMQEQEEISGKIRMERYHMLHGWIDGRMIPMKLKRSVIGLPY